MQQIVRVLVVDDSAYVRKVVKQMLSRSPFIEVVGTARDGKEALDQVSALKPDVVTCDLIMPQMNGVDFVREQMRRVSVPVIIMSVASETGELALAALDAGALDFIQKPSPLASDKIFEISDELIEKVKAAAAVPVARLSNLAAQETVRPHAAPFMQGQHRVDIVTLGISTGGPQALRYLVPRLPADFAVPLVMVMHMPLGYTEMYARKLDELSALTVREARDGEVLTQGLALLAPAGRHLSFQRREDGCVVAHLDSRPLNTLHRPSVDVMFQSAAEVFGARVLGVVMTGMGSDGKEGSAWIKSQGGLVYTESEETCVVYGMPASVVEAGLSDKSVPLNQLAEAIQEIV